MAALGENVGRAYVRILADGDGLDESIRKQFQDADGAFDESGRRGSQRYRDAFAREMESRPTQTRLRRSISDALAKGDFLQKDFLNSRNWKEFKNGLEKEFGDAGRLAGERLERELVQGMTFDQLKGKLDNIQPLITSAQRDILKNDRDFIRDRNAAYEEHRRRMGKIVQGLDQEFQRVSNDIDRFGKGDRGAPARQSLLDDLGRIGREMRSAGGHTDDFARSLANQEDRLRRIHPRLTAADALFGRFGNTVGRLFGKGSRNNFINFIGGIVGGLAGALRIIPRAISGFLDLGAGIRQAMQDAASEGAGSLRVAMAGVTASLESGGTALVIFAAAAVGTMFLIGPLVALLSSLAGILVALSGTVVFGLIGALGALAGAAVPLAGLIGGLVLTFKNMSDQQKTLVKEAVQPLKREFTGLVAAMRTPIFDNLAGQIRRVTPALSGLHPMFHDLGVAISDVGDHFASAIDSPGFRTFRGAMETFLPDAVRSLGISIGNALGGLGGIFVALVPLAEQFLGWVQRITGEFARWANSDAGRGALLDFFDRAGQSAKSLGGFITASIGFLGQLLGMGQATGNNIFDQMATSIREATQWLVDNPDAVANWFGSAQNIANDIGSLITGLTELADAFDNANTRALASAGLKEFAILVQIAATIVQADAILISGAFHGIAAAVRGVVGFITSAVQGIIGAFQNIRKSFTLPRLGGRGPLLVDIRSIAGAMVRGFANVGPAIARLLTGIPGRVRAIFNRIGPVARAIIPQLIRPFSPVVGRIANAINGLPGRVRGIFNRLPGIARGVISGITRPFAPVIGRIMGLLNGLPGRVRGLVNRLPGIARSAATNTANAFRSVPGRIMGLLSGIPGRVAGLLNRLGGIARTAASRAVSPFSGIAGRIAGHFSGVGGAVAGRLAGIAGAARNAASAAVGAFRGLAGRIISAVGTIHLPTPTIHMPSIPKIHIPGLAAGGIEQGLRGVGVIRQIGEAGPEAVVPLDRPLAQVDPSVRALSAIAQGLHVPGMASGGVVGGGKSVDVGGITVYTVTQDPRAVAAEVFNRFAAAAY